jgi:hypothetical protein
MFVAGAAVYNLALGAWAIVLPRGVYELFRLPRPGTTIFWSCLGMVLGVYGIGYAYAAWRPDQGRVIVALGLLGKILGPIGWAVAVGAGELPGRTLTLIVLDDVVWWIPFGLFVAEGTRAAARLRGLAPFLCAATNGLALVLMGLVLAPGTEIVTDAAARYRYIAQHHGLWSAGWAVWIAAALTLVGFYAWWATHLPRGWQPLAAVALAGAGLLSDVVAESLYIGWFPGDAAAAGPVATFLTGGVANGLYTLAGAWLTWQSRTLPRWARAWAWAIWSAGGLVTAFTLAHLFPGVAVATAVLFVLFCPWIVVTSRRMS